MQKSFQEVSAIWCETKSLMVKYSTMCAYKLTLKTHLIPKFGAMKTISESDVQRFVIDKLSSGLSRKTLKDIIAVLRSIVKFGGKHKMFPYEEWDIEYPTDNTEIHKLSTLTLNHQRILMRYLTQDPNPKNIGVLLSCCTSQDIEKCLLRYK